MISDKMADEMINLLLKKCGDFAEIYVENTEKIEMKEKNRSVRTAIKKNISGIGIRVIKDGQEYFTSTNKFSRTDILQCIDELAYLINGSSQIIRARGGYKSKENILNRSFLDVGSFIKKSKNYMDLIDKASRDWRQIRQTDITMWRTVQNIQIANSNGIFAQDKRNRSRLIVRTLAEENGKIEENIVVRGSSKGENIFECVDAETVGVVCAKQAVDLLRADMCPSGKMPIVIAGGLGGSIFHEACGHSLEASCVACGNSEFSGKLGKMVASPLVSLIDDGTIEGQWGTSLIDDEGIPCKKNILIENGVLKGYLIDYLNSAYMGLPATGNARRESYCFAPTSRMTNTYIMSGNDSEDEIISSVPYGIYVEEFKGGSVNPTTGDFNADILRGYLIKNGKIDRLIKGGTLVGNGSDIMKKIDRVGNKLTWSQGMCGAKSGLLPVGIGQPMIRLEEGTLGGNG